MFYDFLFSYLFFFKQKTAYEMRISDWSSDVCSSDLIAIPALLACSATHQSLVRAGLRTNTGLVMDTGSAREVHHFALLAGYGAEAICPWLEIGRASCRERGCQYV